MGSSLCQLEPRPEWTKGEIELKIESPTPCIFFVTHTLDISQRVIGTHSGSAALTTQRHSRVTTQRHSASLTVTQRHSAALQCGGRP